MADEEWKVEIQPSSRYSTESELMWGASHFHSPRRRSDLWDPSDRSYPFIRNNLGQVQVYCPILHPLLSFPDEDLRHGSGWSLFLIVEDGQEGTLCMAIETLGAALRQINRLFADGVVAGLSDAQLLERFLTQGDAGAFEALVGRHGPMVLGVCRRILRDPHDAEDAFQATFLVLVQKGGAVRGRDALAGWLHQVAHRVALRANAAAARRRALEREVGEMAVAATTNGPGAPDDVLRVLDEEIVRLPEKLRLAIVYCDLEGLTQAKAAGQLHWSKRTLQHRLAEGRSRLRRRLARRGLAPDGATLGAVLAIQAQVPVSAGCLEATVRAATVGGVSAAVQRMVLEELKAMLLHRLTWASATLLAGGLVACGASAALVSFEQVPSPKLAATLNSPLQRKAGATLPQPGPTSLDPHDKVTVRGRVLAPDGRPVPGAKLYLTPSIGYLKRPYPSPEWATTGRDGRFQIAVQDPKFVDRTATVTAAAEGYGVAWAEVPAGSQGGELTLQLVDDAPVIGQIVDLEGRPVRGATLRVVRVNAAQKEDLDPWFEAAKGKKGYALELEQRYLSRFTVSPPLESTTDAEGRFRLSGIGRDRLVVVQLDGPDIASQHLRVFTRSGEMILIRDEPSLNICYYGAGFRHVAGPTRPIVGMVRDKDTKRPLEGITIRSDMLPGSPSRGQDMLQTATDAEGRYRLTGMPKVEGTLGPFGSGMIMAVPGTDQPYVLSAKEVPQGPGPDPVTVDLELKRGVWIEGKVTDKATGKPLQGGVKYFALSTNPNLPAYGGFDTPVSSEVVETGSDGSYRIAGLPGPGLVAVLGRGHYLKAADRDDEEGTTERLVKAAPHFVSPESYNALAWIDPTNGVDSVKRDVALERGWTCKGTVFGPDGHPLAGARSFSLIDQGKWEPEGMRSAEFELREFNPRRPRELLFQHLEKGLIGVAPRPKRDGDAIAVPMRPGAVVTGRLVDAGGRPRAGVELRVGFRSKEWPIWQGYSPERIKTDQEGRFRVEALLPGNEYRLSHSVAAELQQGELHFGEALRPGQTMDLGDVRMTVSEE